MESYIIVYLDDSNDLRVVEFDDDPDFRYVIGPWLARHDVKAKIIRIQPNGCYTIEDRT